MIIESRFNGPPGSGNGGWSAGLFATAVTGTGPANGSTGPATGGTGPAVTGTGPAGGGTGPVEVTLRRPPPLEVPLTADERGDVHDQAGQLVAQVRQVEPFTALVPPVDRTTAAAASEAYPGFVDHPFPGCYVCGPQHPDGLRIFPGRLPDGRTAAPFRAPAEVAPATVWAALDCPGGWAVITPGRPYVLGRIAVRVAALPAPGDECVVTGAMVGGEGRRAQVHSTLYGPDGAVLGQARATWIALPPG